jgi:hypothetical protein
MVWSFALGIHMVKTVIFINFLISILGCCLLLALSLAISAIFDIQLVLNQLSTKNLNLLPGVAIASAGLIAVLAYIRDRRNQNISIVRKRDEVYLVQVREAFDEVFEILKDQNNENVSWVRASRLLLRGGDIKSKILTPDMQETSLLVEENLRSKLHRVLEFKPDVDCAYEPLPPQFFYGINDWKTEKYLDEAARKGSSRIVVTNVTIDQNIPTPSGDAISSKAVIAIYCFLEYPNNYDDPLNRVIDWDDDWINSHGINQGAKRYIYHKRNTLAVDGKLHK